MADEDILAGFDQAPLAPLGQAVGASTANPEVAGKAFTLGKETGFSSVAIEADLDNFLQQEKSKKASEAMQFNPAAARYVEKNPLAAKVSNDDWTELHNAAGAFNALMNIGHENERLPDGRIPEGKELITTREGRRNLASAIAWMPAKMMKDLFQGAALATETPERANAGELTEVDAQRERMTALARMDFGINVGVLMELGKLPATPFARDFDFRLPADIRAGAELPRAPGTSSPEEIQSFLATAEGFRARQEIDDFIRAKEAKPEEPQLRLTVHPEPKAVEPPHPVAAAMVKQGELPPTGLDKLVDEIRVEKTAVDSQNFQVLFDRVQETKTLQRSPEAMAAYLDEVTQGRQVWLPAAELAKMPPEAFAYVPDLERQLEVARETGADIQVSMADYLARTDKPTHDKLKDLVRLRQDGLTKEEAKEVIEVYHGSPAKFEAFDSTFMGSGEGAQAYAYGHYLAENKAVAEEYAKNVVSDAKLKRIAELEKQLEGLPEGNTRDAINAEIYELDQKEPGNVYKAQIKGKPEDFLDWDLPIGQQSPQVKAALKKLGYDETVATTGEDVHRQLEMELGKKGKPDASGMYRMTGKEEAAKALSEAGIPGIKFLDQGSRPGPGGMNSAGVKLHKPPPTRNFVVFSDADIKITHRNEIPLSAEAQRILATPAAQISAQATAAEKASLYLHPLFENGKAVGMTETEFKQYSAKIAKMDEATLNKAIALAKRDIAKRQTAEWKKNEAEIRQEVETDLRNRQDIIADRFFRTGDLPTGERVAKVSLDRAAVEAITGEGSLSGFTKADGVHPDEIADFIGYASGAEMVKALDLLDMTRKSLGESPKAYFDRVAKQKTADLMEERYGNLERNILDEARDAALAVGHSDILASEMAILARAAGGEPPLTRPQIENWVREKFNGIPLEQASRYENFRRATEKAGREAEKALLSGKFDEAFQAKQRQLLAFLMAKEAQGLKRDLAKAYRDWSRLEERTVANVDQAFLNEIHRVLDQIGWGNKRQALEFAETMAGTTLEGFAQDKAAEGIELAIPTFLLDPGFKKATDKLTTEEFQLAKEAIESLQHNGKEARLIEVEGKKIAFDLLKADIINNLTQLPLRDLSKGEKSDKIRLKIDAELARMEALADDFDLRDPLGPFNTAVFRPVTNAKHRENAMLDDLGKKLAALNSGKKWQSLLDEDVAQDILRDPRDGTPLALKRSDVIQIALNLGNASNASKLARGYTGNPPYGSHIAARTEFALRKLVNDTLSKEDWKYVQGIWDIFKGLKVEADAMYRDLSGVAPNSIKATPFSTPFGEVTGGYYPIIYDKYLSSIQVLKEADRLRGTLESDYHRATTPNGYTKDRVEAFAEPLAIRSGLDQVAQKMAQEVHDIAFRRAIIDASKIIYDKDIRSAVRNHYGPEYERQLTPWLEAVANKWNSNEAALGWFNSVLRGVRMNLVVQALGGNLKLVMSPDMGKALMELSTAKNMFRSPKNAVSEWNLAQEKSAELRHTMENLDRDFREKFEGLAQRNGWNKAKANIAWASMLPASQASHVFRTITWLAEYRRARGDGIEEGDAIFMADKQVREQHGSSHTIDLPAMFRGDEGMKMLTLFQTYFNTNYNRMRTVPGDIRSGEFMQAASTTSWFFLFPAVIGWLVFNEFKKDESTPQRAGKSLLMQAATYHPISALLSAAWIQGYSSRTPISSMIKGVGDAVGDLGKVSMGKEQGKKAVQHLINLPGLVFGLPTGQIARTFQFLNDVRTRRQNPQTFGQWFRGVVYGEAQERRK